MFLQRLDKTGPTPQPEASYEDAATGRMLVIERKSLIWPPNFGQQHSSSHEVADIIDKELAPALDAGRAYRLTLRDDLTGRRPELRRYAASVAQAIKQRLEAVHHGETVRARWPNREWLFCEEPASERDFAEPTTGLVFQFDVPHSDLDYGVVSDGLKAEWKRLITAARRKFEQHQSAKCVLVIDPYADVRWSTDQTWRLILNSHDIPTNIHEIWVSMHTMLTELHCGWMQKELWPHLSNHQLQACHDPTVVAAEERVNTDDDNFAP